MNGFRLLRTVLLLIVASWLGCPRVIAQIHPVEWTVDDDYVVRSWRLSDWPWTEFDPSTGETREMNRAAMFEGEKSVFEPVLTRVEGLLFGRPTVPAIGTLMASLTGGHPLDVEDACRRVGIETSATSTFGQTRGLGTRLEASNARFLDDRLGWSVRDSLTVAMASHWRMQTPIVFLGSEAWQEPQSLTADRVVRLPADVAMVAELTPFSPSGIREAFAPIREWGRSRLGALVSSQGGSLSPAQWLSGQFDWDVPDLVPVAMLGCVGAYRVRNIKIAEKKSGRLFVGISCDCDFARLAEHLRESVADGDPWITGLQVADTETTSTEGVRFVAADVEFVIARDRRSFTEILGLRPQDTNSDAADRVVSAGDQDLAVIVRGPRPSWGPMGGFDELYVEVDEGQIGVTVVFRDEEQRSQFTSFLQKLERSDRGRLGPPGRVTRSVVPYVEGWFCAIPSLTFKRVSLDQWLDVIVAL